MNDKERNDYLERRGIDILDVGENVDEVLREIWDEAQRQAAPTWQPIDTAPKDGTWILLAVDSSYTTTPLTVSVCRYISSPYPSWRDYADYKFLVGGNEPTHWMPLPPTPPTSKTLSEKLSDILSKFELDEESVYIILCACSQLQKQEQAND